MTETGRTEPLPGQQGSTRVGDDLAIEHDGPRAGTAPRARGERTDDDRDRNGRSDRLDPVQAVQQPDNRAKLLIATALMTLLNLLLLVGILVSMQGSDFETVTVDGQACVIELADGDQSTLYCQR